MAWCPICKTQYEDQEVCPDCTVNLMSGSPEDYTDIFSFKNEEVTLNIYNRLLEIGVEAVQYYYDAKDEIYHIICDNDYEADAKKQIIFFVQDDLAVYLTPSEQTALSFITNQLISDVNPKESSSENYVSAEDKYVNVKSSAVSLLTVGILGLIIFPLDILGILPFSGSSKVLFMCTMSFVFIMFIVMGFISFKNAGKLKQKIVEENNLHNDIRAYITNELDLSPADKNFDNDTAPEEKCLFRTGYITLKTREKFPDASKAIVDYMVEDLYDELYPDDCQFDDSMAEVLRDDENID